jgi:hypothetical protein
LEPDGQQTSIRHLRGALPPESQVAILAMATRWLAVAFESRGGSSSAVAHPSTSKTAPCRGPRIAET